MYFKENSFHKNKLIVRLKKKKLNMVPILLMGMV